MYRSVKPLPRYLDFYFCQDGGSHHLGVLKFYIFKDQYDQERRTASLCQILSKSFKRRRRYVTFRFFKMTAAAILDFWNFKFLTVVRSRGSNCIILPNFVKIGKTAAELWRFFDFFKMEAAASCDFENFKFLTVGRVKRVELRHYVKFGQKIGQTAAEIWQCFDFSRWRPPPSWIFKISNF